MAKFRIRKGKSGRRTVLPAPTLTPEQASLLQRAKDVAAKFTPIDVPGDFLDNTFRKWVKGYGFDLDFGKSQGVYIRRVQSQSGAPQATIGGAGFTNRSLRELLGVMSRDASVSPQDRQKAISIAEAIQAHDTRQRVARGEQKGPATVLAGPGNIKTEPRTGDVYDLDGNQYVVRMSDGRTRPLEITQEDISKTMGKGVPPPYMPKGTKKSGEPKDPIFPLEYGVRTGKKSGRLGVDLSIDVVRNAMKRMGLKATGQLSMNNVGIIDLTSGEFVTRGISRATTAPQKGGIREEIFEIYKRDLNQPGRNKLLSQVERQIPFSEKGGASDLPPGDVIIKDPETGRYMFRTRGGEMMGLAAYKARYPGNKKVARVVEALEDPSMQDPVAALESGVTSQPKSRPTDIGKRLVDENDPDAVAAASRRGGSFGGERDRSPADEAVARARAQNQGDEDLLKRRKGRLVSSSQNVVYRGKEGNLQVGRNYTKKFEERGNLLSQLIKRKAQELAAAARDSRPKNLKPGRGEQSVEDSSFMQKATEEVIAAAQRDGIDLRGSSVFRGRGLGSQYNPETKELQLVRVRGETTEDVTPIPSTRVLPPKGSPAEVSSLARPNPLGAALSVTRKSMYGPGTYTRKATPAYMDTPGTLEKEIEWLRGQLDPTVSVRSSPGKTQFNPEGSSRLVTGARERNAGVIEGTQINIGTELRETIIEQYKNALKRQNVKPDSRMSILESGTPSQIKNAFVSVLRQNKDLRGNRDLVRSIIASRSERAADVLLRGAAKEAGKGGSMGRDPAKIAAQSERNPLSYFRYLPGEGPEPGRRVRVGEATTSQRALLGLARNREQERTQEAIARNRRAEAGRQGFEYEERQPPEVNQSPIGRLLALLRNPEERRSFEARARRNALLLGDSRERQLMKLMGPGYLGYYPPVGRRQLRPIRERLGNTREEAIRKLMALSGRASPSA
jgi:hypothetical protein